MSEKEYEDFILGRRKLTTNDFSRTQVVKKVSFSLLETGEIVAEACEGSECVGVSYKEESTNSWFLETFEKIKKKYELTIKKTPNVD